MRKLFPLLFCFLSFVRMCYADDAKKSYGKDVSWRLLQNAQVAFENTEYGLAMNLANQAKEKRLEESNYEADVLVNALSPLDVRNAGSEFESVLAVLAERDQLEAISVIRQYLDLYGAEHFKNSVYDMLAWIEKKGVYPEADYLVGKIYRLEGEYSTAYDFYEKARVECDFLDVPDQIFEILYEMADLAEQMGRRDQYEQILLLILSNDENYDDAVLRRALFRIINADRPESIDRFFMLFRADSVKTLSALYDIAAVFEENGEKENSLFCSALGTIEAFTHIHDSISGRDSGYEFSTFAGFLTKVAEYEDIVQWCNENRVWDFFILFCKKSAAKGSVRFSNAMLGIMAENLPQQYWRAVALNSIVSF